MMLENAVQVKVPATSANLGVGYDVLGLALKRYMTVTFTQKAQGLVIRGDQQKFANQNNLIYQAFLKAAAALQQPVPGLAIAIDSDIPVARGLGSSAACIVAGLAGANALYHGGLSQAGLLGLATAMEGHPDNAAPAIYGQLTATIMAEGKPQVMTYKLDPSWQLATLIPNYPVLTAKARAVLPASLSYPDAVYQMGRCTLMTAALERGDEAALKLAATDRMHEPYRMALLPDFQAVRTIGRAFGVTVVLSGSGSTMLALGQDQLAMAKFLGLAKQRFADWTIDMTAVESQGVQVLPLAEPVFSPNAFQNNKSVID